MNSIDVVKSILDGSLDRDLKNIQEAITNRQDLIAGIRKETFDGYKIGDHVKFNDLGGTRYLHWKPCKIVDIKRKRVVVMLDDPIGRFQGRISTHPELLTKK